TSGMLFVLVLWIIAIVSLAGRRHIGWSLFAIAWGLVIAAIGFMQVGIMPILAARSLSSPARPRRLVRQRRERLRRTAQRSCAAAETLMRLRNLSRRSTRV